MERHGRQPRQRLSAWRAQVDVLSAEQAHPRLGALACATRPMHDSDIPIKLEQLRIYEDDELIFDGSDPTTYTILRTPE